jgi:hypothetical protein
MLLTLFPLLRYGFDQPYKKISPLILFVLVPFFIFPILHQAAFLGLLACTTLWTVLWFKKIPRTVVLVYWLGVCIAGISFLLFTAGGTQQLAFQPGFLATDKTLWGVLSYWFFNAGLYLLLLPLIFIVSNRKMKVFLLPFICFFLLANLFRLTPDMINNHKLINLTFIAGNMVVAGWLVERSRNFFAKVLFPAVLITLTLSGLIDFMPILNDHYLRVKDMPKNEMASWVKNNTSPQAVFLTDTSLYHPVLLAGRRVLYDYGYFNWSMGHNDQPRRQAVKSLMSGPLGRQEICAVLAELDVDYLYVHQPEEKLEEVSFQSSSIYREFTSSTAVPAPQLLYDVSMNCLEMDASE